MLECVLFDKTPVIFSNRSTYWFYRGWLTRPDYSDSNPQCYHFQKYITPTLKSRNNTGIGFELGMLNSTPSELPLVIFQKRETKQQSSRHQASKDCAIPAWSSNTW